MKNRRRPDTGPTAIVCFEWNREDAERFAVPLVGSIPASVVATATAAAAATSTTATAPASSAAAAATTGAGTARLAGTGLVDGQPTSVMLLIVEGVDRGPRLGLG